MARTRKADSFVAAAHDPGFAYHLDWSPIGSTTNLDGVAFMRFRLEL